MGKLQKSATGAPLSGGNTRRYRKRKWEASPHNREQCSCRCRSKILGAIKIGANTRIGAGSVVVGNVEADCTVVGVPGRVIHQSGVRINPLAHSALPDAEANVIRNLMERIDELENQVEALIKTFGAEGVEAASQNIKDKEIMEYLGEAQSE